MSSDDAELARRIAAGDEGAAAALDAKYRTRLEAVACRADVPVADCGDVAQETLAAAMAQIRAGAFRGESGVGTWLFAILKNKIAGYWRDARRNPARAVHDPLSEDPLAELVARAVDPALRLDVQRALGRLPAVHRLIFVMNRFGGLTTDEIADRLGRPPGTVGRILADAKRQFREAFRREDSGRDPRLLEE
jgi:RNA polymerase sigma-70 factor (ECF subfamily)